MKDFDKIDTAETDRKVVEIPVPSKKIRLGYTPIFKGMIVWEINESNGVCLPAKFKKSAVVPNENRGDKNIVGDDLKSDVVHHQCIKRAGYFYVIAINKKNAIRKYQKILGRGMSGTSRETSGQ